MIIIIAKGATVKIFHTSVIFLNKSSDIKRNRFMSSVYEVLSLLLLSFGFTRYVFIKIRRCKIYVNACRNKFLTPTGITVTYV